METQAFYLSSSGTNAQQPAHGTPFRDQGVSSNAAHPHTHPTPTNTHTYTHTHTLQGPRSVKQCSAPTHPTPTNTHTYTPFRDQGVSSDAAHYTHPTPTNPPNHTHKHTRARTSRGVHTCMLNERTHLARPLSAPGMPTERPLSAPGTPTEHLARPLSAPGTPTERTWHAH